MKVKEVIVVEGKNDIRQLERWIDAEFLETSGTGLNESTLNRIQELAKVRGVIVFTDPDSPGDQIRQKINAAVAGCKNAFLPSNLAWEIVKGKRKVGIEHANQETICNALSNLMTYEEAQQPTLTWDEFVELGLTGFSNSSQRRKQLGNALHLGEANGKTLWKRCNMMRLTKAQLIEKLEELE